MIAKKKKNGRDSLTSSQKSGGRKLQVSSAHGNAGGAMMTTTTQSPVELHPTVSAEIQRSSAPDTKGSRYFSTAPLHVRRECCWREQAPEPLPRSSYGLEIDAASFPVLFFFFFFFQPNSDASWRSESISSPTTVINHATHSLQ